MAPRKGKADPSAGTDGEFVLWKSASTADPKEMP